ncbi:hypothetical protein F5148DRAFT_1256009, partial [Russula earlei]
MRSSLRSSRSSRQAWDQWDRQRRLHYAQQAQAAAGAGKPPDGQPLGEVAPPHRPTRTQPRSSWATHRRQHSPSPRRILTNIRRRKQTIFAHAFIARSSRRPFAPCFIAHRSDVTTGVSAPLAVVSPQAASVPALPATLPPQFLALPPSSASPPTTLASPSPVTVLLTTAASLLLTVAVSAPIPASRFSLQPSAMLRARALKRTERVEAEKRTEA